MMYLAVALGGAMGAVMRYSLVMLSGMPSAILMANVLGSFVLGGLLSAQQGGVFNLSPIWQGFLMVGILGAFTTFSTFSLEAFVLFQQGEVKQAVAYVIASVFLAILGFALGYRLISFFY